MLAAVLIGYGVELQDRRTNKAVPAKVRDNCLNQLMQEKFPEPMMVLEWLRRPPRKQRSRKTDRCLRF